MEFHTGYRRLLSGIVATAAISAMVLSSGLDALAIDLPTKTINGKEYFYREVKSKETIYGLAKELGISKAEIIKYNPAVADGLRAGTTLYFPVSEMPQFGKAESGKETRSTTRVAEAKVENKSNAQVSGGDIVHLVEKGETIYGISKHYGITQDELIEANPQVKTGLKRGTILHIPSKGAISETTSDEEPAAIDSTPMTDAAPETEELTAPKVFVPEPETEPAATEEPSSIEDTQVDNENKADDSLLALLQPTDSIAPDSVVAGKNVTEIAVILPFMLQQTTPDKQAQLYTEFYKGLLIAADSLRDSHHPIIIRAYDSANNTDSVKSILAKDEISHTDLIITPDDDEQLNLIAAHAEKTGAKVLNIFAVKGTQYLTNPTILQANIPHSAMYEQAIDEFMKRNDDCTVVFLSSMGGKNDKVEFCDLLRRRLSDEGRKYIDVNYNVYLKAADLSELNTDSSYVFVPSSATASEFSHIISALKNYRESLSNYGLVRMFGYPEWITFRGDALENLHLMNATVYSRFFNDSDSPRSKDFANTYKRWYGTPLMSAVPVQGMLGFDTGFYIIKAINRDADNIGEPNYFYDGIQSGFHFLKTDDTAGLINDALYFINFRPSGITDKQYIQR